jgi:hypothetical protein
VTLADGEGAVLGVVETPYPEGGKPGACPLQAANLGNAAIVVLTQTTPATMEADAGITATEPALR